MDLVSIIMPVYNASRFLEESIQSVLAQTYTNFELIIINDGSKDGSFEIIQKYQKQDKRILIIDNKKNLGVVKCLNIGLRKSSGDYIARIDADDIWFPEKLMKQISFLRNNPNISLLGSSVIPINKSGEEKGKKIFNDQVFLEGEKLKEYLFKRNPFCHSSIIFPASIINEIGAYDENFINSEDYEFWFRILSKKEGTIKEEKFVKYRIYPEMISLKKRKEQTWYAIKAKVKGIKYFKKPLYYYSYLIFDLIDLIRPKFLSKLKKRFLNLL